MITELRNFMMCARVNVVATCVVQVSARSVEEASRGAVQHFLEHYDLLPWAIEPTSPTEAHYWVLEDNAPLLTREEAERSSRVAPVPRHRHLSLLMSDAVKARFQHSDGPIEIEVHPDGDEIVGAFSMKVPATLGMLIEALGLPDAEQRARTAIMAGAAGWTLKLANAHSPTLTLYEFNEGVDPSPRILHHQRLPALDIARRLECGLTDQALRRMGVKPADARRQIAFIVPDWKPAWECSDERAVAQASRRRRP